MALYQHRFFGHTAAGENFVFSWWSNTAASLESVQTAASAWATDFWTTTYGSLVTPEVGLDGVRTGLIDMATGQQQELAEGALALVGSAVGMPLPADVCIVASLRTNLANRRGRGRFYLPQPAASNMTTDGKMLLASQGAIADALKGAFDTYNATGELVVYSRTSRTVATVVSLNVGDLFDTQRRRENSIPESRLVRILA